jgi:hypothetical protein
MNARKIKFDFASLLKHSSESGKVEIFLCTCEEEILSKMNEQEERKSERENKILI